MFNANVEYVQSMHSMYMFIHLKYMFGINIQHMH